MSTARNSLTLLPVLMLAWPPSEAAAREESTEFWLFGTLRGNLSDEIFLGVDTAYRWRDEGSDSEQQTLRVTLEHGILDGSRLGGGIALFTADGISEVRPHQQFRFISGGLDLRTRLEQRFFDGADRVELRLRQRVQYTLPLGSGIEGVASGEYLTLLQTRDFVGRRGTQQVRALAGINIPIGSGFHANPAYMLLYSPRPEGTDRLAHIPQVTINYTF